MSFKLNEGEIKKSLFINRKGQYFNIFQLSLHLRYVMAMHCPFEICKFYERIPNSEAGVKLCSRERQRQLTLCSPPAPSGQCGPG